MAASETNLGTDGRGDDRKQTPEEIAEERIEAAREKLNPGACSRTERRFVRFAAFVKVDGWGQD